MIGLRPCPLKTWATRAMIEPTAASMTGEGKTMLRRAVLPVLAALVLALVPATATAQTNGGGNSGEAPGQETAADNCRHVFSDVQADLVAGGGPKSHPVDDPGGPFTTGPTNCDHFWQTQGVIGKK
jgi:hypothetical protein